MNITDISIDVIERIAPPVRVQDERTDLGGTTTQGVLRVRTEDGLEGNAFVGDQAGDSSQRMSSIIRTLKPVMMGRDSSDREWLWNQLPVISGHGGAIEPVWAPLDVALWDIEGKAANKPIHKLLGTARTEAPLYATFPPRHDTPEGFVEEALQLQSEGFRAYKIHPGPLSARDAAIAAAKVRGAVGDDMTLMLDRNHGYTFREALFVGHALDANGFFWFEDPVPANDIESIRELTRRLETPLNMSDTTGFLFHEAANFLQIGAVRLVRGTVRKIGITGLKKQMSLVEGFHKFCEIGLAGNSAMNAANLHVMMSSLNCTYFEYWLPREVHQWGVVSQLEINGDGNLDAPTGPGLGVELDEDWIASHKVATLS
ncbi:MAG: enolase C-terminal domain-like protein [Dehalococcoidia bacterium]|jgi:L-alanine-DL-glutamate epimerase-like enolase superfamily enzyme|nr:enolase C-terminal domain-like protein [Dehalococcoidia bacterium]